MRRENYTGLIWAILIFSALILVAFQLYINREPIRIQAVRAADRAAAVAVGEELYQANCTSCHGDRGEGVDAPALNNLAILGVTSDETFFDLTANGIPGTEMPAWSQARGGPFTDEEIKQIVTYIRSWEPTAPDLGQQQMRVDARRGARIYAATCVVCHGENGQGDTAPALNDPAKLQQFENEWYAETIAAGRPAQGMPVWGTVLSPQQIGDLVALIDAWRQGKEIILGDVDSLLKDALHTLEHNETVEAIELLEQAVDSAEHEQADVIEEAIAALDVGSTEEALTIIEQAQAIAGDQEHDAEEKEHDVAEEEHDADEEEHDAAEGDTAEEEHDVAEEEHDAVEEEHDAVEEEHDAAEETSAESAIDSGVAHLQEAVHALEHNELDEAENALAEAMELLSSGELFEAAEHGLEDIEAGKPDEAFTVITEALTAAGIPLPEEEETEASTVEEAAEAAIDPGIAHLQEAVHALEHNELGEAQNALAEAMELLPSGELFEAAEHGLEDIEAGKPDEALTVLQEALTAAGIPLLEED